MNTTNNKFSFEKIINGRTMRYDRKDNVWVNKEGTYAYREYSDPNLNSALLIHTGIDGSKYLNTKNPGIIPLDKAVAICFKPMPQDGKKYVLIHKDRDLGNCHVSNLEWGISQSQVKSSLQTDKERILNNGLVVREDGTILDKRKKLAVITNVGDADTDRSCVAVEPYVRYNRKNRYKSTEEKHSHIDDLMAEAGFVEGDKSSMTSPKVLHKDLDYLNFNSSNLKWSEETSQEYQDYMKKKKEDMDQLTIKGNPNHPNPLMKKK